MYNTDLTCAIGVPKSKSAWTRSAQDYKNEITRNYVPLSKDDMNMYLHLIRNNDARKDEYITKIMNSLGPVLMRCAFQFADARDYMDYVQEGACVVLDCIYGYDLNYKSKTSFLTYCIHSIFYEYGNIYMKYHSSVTYSAHITNHVIVGLQKYVDMISRQTGIPATEDDIRSYCESVKIPYVPSLLDTLKTTSIDVAGTHDDKDADCETSLAYTMSSHDENLDPDVWVSTYDNEALVTAIRKAYGTYVERKYAKAKTTINKERMLRNLEILFDFYGVEGREPLNVYQLGLKYNMDRERARQIVTEMPGVIQKIISQNIK